MTTLLYHPAGARSAPALAREMNATPIRHRHAGRVPAGTTLIRWGSAAATPPVPREINSRRSLSA